MSTIKRTVLVMGILLVFTVKGLAQYVDMDAVNPEYINVLEGRTSKFLEPMGLEDNYEKVQSIVIEQYCNLSAIHDSLAARKERVKGLDISEEEIDARVEALKNERDAHLYIRHNAFLAQLLGELTYEQVDQIKNGMTYSVMPNTYQSFQDMLLDLTEEQKQKIWVWLYEARERAMDMGSSDDKHKMFGEYKGRINNYLSDQGYDLKKESKAWHERMKKEGKKF